MPVYFVRPAARKIVKIGYADDAESRLRSLQCANHEPLRVLAIIDGPPRLEGEIHARFRSHRLHGEWFALDGELEKFIASLKPFPAPFADIEHLWRQDAELYGFRTKKPQGPPDRAIKVDDAMKRQIKRMAALKGDDRMTLQQIADKVGIAQSTIFWAFKGGRQVVLKWKPLKKSNGN